MTPLEKAGKALMELQGFGPWELFAASAQEPYLVQARAVLQAIREPGDAIASTGAGIIQGPIGGCAKAAATQCFAGMIDAILEAAK